MRDFNNYEFVGAARVKVCRKTPEESQQTAEEGRTQRHTDTPPPQPTHATDVCQGSTRKQGRT